MSRSDALAHLHDTATLWSAGFGWPDAVVRAACDALASGEDGCFLAMLAALPFRTLEDGDVEDLLEQSLSELGLPYFAPRTREAKEAALGVMARRTLAGSIAPCDLASWTHRAFGHGRLALAERLAELDDVYDTVEYADVAVSDVDADIIAEARRIAAHLPRLPKQA